jgi:hypothetical protein
MVLRLCGILQHTNIIVVKLPLCSICMIMEQDVREAGGGMSFGCHNATCLGRKDDGKKSPSCAILLKTEKVVCVHAGNSSPG